MEKNKKIKSGIGPSISLTQDELLTFCNAFEVKQLKKNDFFFFFGQVCNFIGLLC